MEFEQVRAVYGVVTSGSPGSGPWAGGYVTAYTVSISVDCVTFTNYVEGRKQRVRKDTSGILILYL